MWPVSNNHVRESRLIPYDVSCYETTALSTPTSAQPLPYFSSHRGRLRMFEDEIRALRRMGVRAVSLVVLIKQAAWADLCNTGPPPDNEFCDGYRYWVDGLERPRPSDQYRESYRGCTEVCWLYIMSLPYTKLTPYSYLVDPWSLHSTVEICCS